VLWTQSSQIDYVAGSYPRSFEKLSNLGTAGVTVCRKQKEKVYESLFYGLFCTMLFLGNWFGNEANAQGSKAAAAPHIAAARALAYEPGNDLIDLYESVCAPALSDRGPVSPAAPPPVNTAEERRVPPRSEWYTPPAKVFDNLYWVGSTQDSTWAVKTSEGVILIDSGADWSAKELITDGLKKLGLDPTQIKYVIISHAHSDRYWGAKYLQETYKARIILSETDWHGIEISPDPGDVKPKKDVVATDGMKLTLGDTTLTIYLTPGHTPGTISTLVPLKEGNQRHVGVVWGGINPQLYGHGVRNGPTLEAVLKTWSESAGRFRDIATKAGADVYMTIHPHYDRAINKIRAVNYRKPGDPHPLVSKDNVNRFLTILKECTDAQLARPFSVITLPDLCSNSESEDPGNDLCRHRFWSDDERGRRRNLDTADVQHWAGPLVDN